MGLGKKFHKAFSKMGQKVSHTVQTIGTKIDKGIDTVAKQSGKFTNGLVKGTGIASRILDAANMAGLSAVPGVGNASMALAEGLKSAHQGALKLDQARDKIAANLKDKRGSLFDKVDNGLSRGIGNVQGRVMGEIKKANNIGGAVKDQYNLEKNNLRKKIDASNAENGVNFA